MVNKRPEPVDTDEESTIGGGAAKPNELSMVKPTDIPDDQIEALAATNRLPTVGAIELTNCRD